MIHSPAKQTSVLTLHFLDHNSELNRSIWLNYLHQRVRANVQIWRRTSANQQQLTVFVYILVYDPLPFPSPWNCCSQEIIGVWERLKSWISLQLDYGRRDSLRKSSADSCDVRSASAVVLTFWQLRKMLNAEPLLYIPFMILTFFATVCQAANTGKHLFFCLCCQFL